MDIAYLPKSEEDFEYIFEHLNEYFPTPYTSVNHLKAEYGGGVIRSFIRYHRSVKVYWGNEEIYKSTANTIQDFHEQYMELRLQSML